jgi:hypothetical protein
MTLRQCGRVPQRLRLIAIAALTPLLVFSTVGASQPERAEILEAMKKATSFMVEKVSLHGLHVWVVSADLSQRCGEVPARASQIWLQGGTERMGQVFADAYEATADPCYLMPRARQRMHYFSASIDWEVGTTSSISRASRSWLVRDHQGSRCSTSD